MKAPIPPDEAQRTDALRECRILDTAPEDEFDDLTRLASRICEAPISLMTLVDENRQWFKSRVGMDAAETARDIGFCAHAILQPGLFVVPDALSDARFADSPLVLSEPKIRFYAGAPLVLRDGHAVGTLCVIDRVPRELTADQREALEILSRQIGVRLDLRRALAEVERRGKLLEAANARLEEALTKSQSRSGVEELKAKERVVSILERVSDAFVSLDRDWCYVYVNEHAAKLFGRRPEDLVGKHIWTEFPEGIDQPFGRAYRKALAEQVSLQIEDYYAPWDRWFENRIYPSPEGLSIFFHEITDRKRAEARIRQLNRLLRTISEIDRLVVRTEERGTLLPGVCWILVEHGGFRMAWVGVCDSASGRVLPEAQAGTGLDYLEGTEIRFDDTPEGRGPTGTAIRTGRPMVVPDLETDPSVAPWRERQLVRGFRSSGAFPIHVRGNVIGAQMVYSAEPGAIGAEETALLDDLARDIGYALEAIEDRTERRQAEKDLREAEEKYRSIFENAVEGIVQTTSDGRFVTVNPSFARMLGYDSPEELVSVIHDTGSQVWLHPERREEFRRLLGDQGVVKGLETELRRKDGITLWAAINAGAVRDSTGAVVFYEGTVEDISERKQAEEALRESEARLRLSVEAANVGLWDWDLQTNRVYFSPEWKRQIGYREDEISHQFHEWESRVHPDDLERTLRKVRAYLEFPEGRHEVEFRFRHKDGSYRWIYAHGNALRGADGKAVRMLGCHIDITEHKRMEEELRDSFQLAGDVVRSIPAGMLVYQYVEPDKLYLLSGNPEAERLTGITFADSIGEEYNETWPAGEAAGLMKAYLDVMRTGEKFETEDVSYEDERLTGSFRVRAFRLPNERLAVSFESITERKRAETELREKEWILAESQRLAHIGSWRWDIASKTIHWSDETYRIYGVTPETFNPTFRTFLGPVHPEDRSRMQEWMRACLSGKRPGASEFRALLPDGSVRTLLGQGELQCGPDQAPVRIVGTVQDITERKRAEEQLHALTERLQSVREEEAARIAREIHDEPGQNLTALRMDLAWLKRELAEKGGSHDEAALARHVDGMTDLVEQTVRTVQRISEELRPGALDQLGLAAAVEARLEDFGRRSGIAARLDNRLENLDVDHALSTTAYRIVQELLTNVVRHAGATEVVVTLAEEEGELVLSLKDNGRGITAAEIAAPRSLGLAGMRERASLAGGSLELSGEPGRGTLATVRLPLVRGRPS